MPGKTAPEPDRHHAYRAYRTADGDLVVTAGNRNSPACTGVLGHPGGRRTPASSTTDARGACGGATTFA